MDFFRDLLAQHAHSAHWYLFGAALLAGLNVPFSIDVLVLFGAILAATVVPENTAWIFGSLLLGCYLSAMCAYWMGRLIGGALLSTRWFSKLMPMARVKSIEQFYNKYGMWALIVGRFIPFGVRNALFMTCGMSRVRFQRFIAIDGIACTLWCSGSFYLFYSLARHYEVLWAHLKTFNLVLFSALTVVVIGRVWYKRRGKRTVSSTDV